MAELNTLKRRAAKLILYVRNELNSVDCGLSLLCTINPRVEKAVSDFNAIYTRIQELDPSAPENPMEGVS